MFGGWGHWGLTLEGPKRLFLGRPSFHRGERGRGKLKRGHDANIATFPPSLPPASDLKSSRDLDERESRDCFSSPLCVRVQPLAWHEERRGVRAVRERALLGRSAMIDRVRTKSIRRESIWRKMRIALLANGGGGASTRQTGGGIPKPKQKIRWSMRSRYFLYPYSLYQIRHEGGGLKSFTTVIV